MADLDDIFSNGPIRDNPIFQKKIDKTRALLKNIKANLPSLEKMLSEVEDHWCEEDLIYRFYHESWKVYSIQDYTKSLYQLLEEISPHEKDKIRDPYFKEIMEDGAKGIGFQPEHNQSWAKTTRPFLEAFFHAKYFVKMAVKYGKEYEFAPRIMDSGWAALLELYGIR